MLETYNPEEQAVINLVFEGRAWTMKMRLESPVMLDEARGVH